MPNDFFEAKVNIRSNFAVSHLLAAHRSARNAREVEQVNASADHGPWFDDLMRLVPVSVVMAGAALEASANELIQDIIDGSILSVSKPRKLLLEDLKEDRSGNAIEKYRQRGPPDTLRLFLIPTMLYARPQQFSSSVAVGPNEGYAERISSRQGGSCPNHERAG
jgi:hypothetical protein